MASMEDYQKMIADAIATPDKAAETLSVLQESLTADLAEAEKNKTDLQTARETNQQLFLRVTAPNNPTTPTNPSVDEADKAFAAIMKGYGYGKKEGS